MIKFIIVIKVNNFKNVLGDSLYNLKRYDEAIQMFYKAIALNPHHSNYYYNIGK